MFGLPFETSLIVFGFPVFWVAYTLIFLWRSRNWSADEARDPDDLDEPAP